jgi:16S rRNA (cytidine1402-2'-O)-methyltransferase
MEIIGTLSIVATPIGNLEDITLRAVRTLKEADVILCEDTRVTGKLLKRLEIDTPMKRCDAEKEMACAKEVEELLAEDKHVAFVSDAGTPGISDPGARLVAHVREYVPEVKIETIPGPSSLAAALSVVGVDAREFTFLGFVPHKKGRQTFFNTLSQYEHPVVFFESPHRIMKTLEALENTAINRNIVVARELTKIHEEVVSGSAKEVFKYFTAHADHQRGEFVIIVDRSIV